MVVVIVAAVLVTGLAVPGWMLGSGGSAGDAKVATQHTAEAYEQQDVQKVLSLRCSDSKVVPSSLKKLTKLARSTHTTVDVTLTGDAHVSGEQATVPVTVAIHGGPWGGRTYTGDAIVKNEGGKWCYYGIAHLKE